MKKIFTPNLLLESFNNKYYFKKDNIIINKFCPVCNKIILNNKCSCGYFYKNKKNSFFKKTFFYSLICSIIFSLILIISFNILKSYSIDSIKNKSIKNLSPVNIQIINNLKKTGFIDYIQNIYIKPKKENQLVIIIKPNLWHILSKDEKLELFSMVKKEWTSIYIQKNPDSILEPKVFFANK